MIRRPVLLHSDAHRNIKSSVLTSATEAPIMKRVFLGIVLTVVLTLAAAAVAPAGTAPRSPFDG